MVGCCALFRPLKAFEDEVDRDDCCGDLALPAKVNTEIEVNTEIKVNTDNNMQKSTPTSTLRSQPSMLPRLQSHHSDQL